MYLLLKLNPTSPNVDTKKKQRVMKKEMFKDEKRRMDPPYLQREERLRQKNNLP